jgi:flagellar biosynthetic protein FliQ
MNPGMAVHLISQAMMMALMVAAPLLATALFVGVAVSLIQALTQIQEQTLTFIPKLIAVAIVLLLCLPWMITQLVQYIVAAFDLLPGMVG